jgi:hypothetical protein
VNGRPAALQSALDRQAALDRLRHDPAVQAADPGWRRWLLALLAYGKRAASAPPSEPAGKANRPRR